MERERFPTMRKPRARVTGLPVPSKPGFSFIPLWSRYRVSGKTYVGLYLTCRLPTQVGSYQDITEESFSLFWMLEPRIGIGGGEG